jgi:hypothetical protein
MVARRSKLWVGEDVVRAGSTGWSTGDMVGREKAIGCVTYGRDLHRGTRLVGLILRKAVSANCCVTEAQISVVDRTHPFPVSDAPAGRWLCRPPVQRVETPPRWI